MHRTYRWVNASGRPTRISALFRKSGLAIDAIICWLCILACAGLLIVLSCKQSGVFS